MSKYENEYFLSVTPCEGQRQVVLFFCVVFWSFLSWDCGEKGPQTVKIKAKVNLKCDESDKTKTFSW